MVATLRYSSRDKSLLSTVHLILSHVELPQLICILESLGERTMLSYLRTLAVRQHICKLNIISTLAFLLTLLLPTTAPPPRVHNLHEVNTQANSGQTQGTGLDYQRQIECTHMRSLRRRPEEISPWWRSSRRRGSGAGAGRRKGSQV